MTPVAVRLTEGVTVPDRVKGCCQVVAPPLPDERAAELAGVHRALADPTRIQMVHILAAAAEPVCVCDFTAAFDLGQPTISHHLAKLREAGLVDQREARNLGLLPAQPVDVRAGAECGCADRLGNPTGCLRYCLCPDRRRAT